MDKVLCLAAGSLAGGFARWLIADAFQKQAGGFPLGTLLVNLSGCLIIGILHGLGETRLPLSPHGRMLLMVGFCGAFTTFSALILESSVMIDKGNTSGAAAYVAASVLIGLLFFRSGAAAARTFGSSPVAQAQQEPNG